MPLHEALQVCKQELSAIDTDDDFIKRLFIFTDFDEPVDATDRELSQQLASDLADSEVDIELFALPAYN